MHIRLISPGKPIAEKQGFAIGAYDRGHWRVAGGKTSDHLAVFGIYLNQPAFEFASEGEESTLVRRQRKLSNTLNLKMRRYLFGLNIEELYAICGCARNIQNRAVL